MENNFKPDKEQEREILEELAEESEKSDNGEISLSEKILKLESEKEELKDKWLRSVAEFENFRRRSAIEKMTWIKNANQRLILELCEVTDNFERAIDSEQTAGDTEHYQKGIEMIQKQIANILKREGVEKIETDGREFDPEYHEALAHIPSRLKENKIAATIQNGYLMNGKVIRAARVAVSNGEEPVNAGETKTTKQKRKK